MTESPVSSSPVSDSDRLRAELQFLTELSQVVASSVELQPILDWVVQKTTGMFGADEGSIKLRGADVGDPMAKTLVRKHRDENESGSWPLPIAMSVMGYMLHSGEGLASTDLLEDSRFPGLRGVETRVRAVLASPLRVGNRITGMLAVTCRQPGRRWTADEAQLLSIVAGSSATVIEQARLRVEAEAKKHLELLQKQMERELEVARGIQMGLVPAASLRAGPWEAMGRVVPARQVGGDYFDYFPLDDDRFGIAIADVSGKGIPAALMMSSVQASLRAFCDGRRPIPEAIRELNRGVTRTATNGKFATLFYGEVDYGNGLVRFTNAGHNYPLLRRRDGTVELLVAGGLPLGLFEDHVFESAEIAFAPGDSLLLYSDGVSEATDSLGGEFGEDRLRTLWEGCAGVAPAEVVARVLSEVERFRGSAGQSDDITVVVVGSPDGR